MPAAYSVSGGMILSSGVCAGSLELQSLRVASRWHTNEHRAPVISSRCTNCAYELAGQDAGDADGYEPGHTKTCQSQILEFFLQRVRSSLKFHHTKK